MNTPAQVVSYLPLIFYGFCNTVLLTLGGLLLGFIIGIVLAFAETYLPRGVRVAASALDQVLRGIPLIPMLFLIYFGFPSLGITFPPLVAASVGLGLRSGGYQSQIFRSALESIGVGQVEASLSIGMGRFEAYRSVLLPQAVRLSIPAWTNEFTIVLKDTSMAIAIGVPEIMTQAANAVALTLQPMQVYLIAAAIYLASCLTINRSMNRLYERVRIPGLEKGSA
jgi:polar amino acid transport system permease protein